MDSEPCWPFLTSGASSPTPLFFPISSPIVDFLTTPKILKFSLCFNYFPFLPYFSMWRSNKFVSLPNYLVLTDVPTYDSFLWTEPLCQVSSNTFPVAASVLYVFHQHFSKNLFNVNKTRISIFSTLLPTLFLFSFKLRWCWNTIIGRILDMK